MNDKTNEHSTGSNGVAHLDWLDAKRDRYWKWRGLVDEWAFRHGISTKSAMSILFKDSPFNPDGEKDLVTFKDLFWAETEEFSDLYFSSNRKANHED